jgi:hypothetical protein
VAAHRARAVHDEEMFGYLVAVERRRADRSHRPFLLLRVDTTDVHGKSNELDPAVAAQVLATLALSLRETDSVGWYRRERVAGALVTELGESPGPEVVELVRRKVKERLRERLVVGEPGQSLRLRISCYPGSGGADTEVCADAITGGAGAAPETRSGQWTSWLRRVRDRVGTARRARTGRARRFLPTRQQATATWQGAPHAPGKGQC